MAINITLRLKIRKQLSINNRGASPFSFLQMDKFLLAENPMAETDNLAIIHMLAPIAIINVVEAHVVADRPHRHYVYNGHDGQEPITLVVWHMFTTEFDSEQHSLMVDKLLRNAFHWYAAYLTWEDNNIENL
jgi:hypothetical protein